MTERPFRILGIQQVAIGGPELDPLRALWIDLFGLTRIGEFESESENVREDILVLGAGANSVEVDLMEPLDSERRPRVDEPRLNHLGLWVDDLVAAVDWLSNEGMRFTPGGIRKGASGHDICFIHPRPSEDQPKSGEGVLIELVQATPEVIAAHGHR